VETKETERRPGRGFHPGSLSPEEVARSLERLRWGHRRWQERRRALPEVVSDLKDLAQLRGRVRARHFEVVLCHLGGLSLRETAAAVGYRDHKAVQRILRRPEIAKMIDLIRAAQLERVIAGDFGVRAQAKAAAPKVMERMIHVGQGGGDVKNADAINAGRVVLTVAGELVEKKTIHAHVHMLIQSMSMEEVEHLAATGQFPERYRNAAEKLGIGQASATE
jgi:hypothetical protein